MNQDSLSSAYLQPPTDAGGLTASTKTFNTFELLENMLLLLDLHTLLLAKRVCIKFRDVVENSSRIQKALFMPPLSSPTMAEMEAMKTWSADDYWNYLDRYYAKPLPKGSSRVVARDPFLTRYLRQRLGYKRGQWRRSRSIYSPTFPSDVMQKLHGSPTSASWRRMLILQPHTAPMEVITNFDYTKNPVFEKTSLQHGLSMGALVDYEVRAHKLLNGKTLTEEMKLTNRGY